MHVPHARIGLIAGAATLMLGAMLLAQRDDGTPRAAMATQSGDDRGPDDRSHPETVSPNETTDDGPSAGSTTSGNPSPVARRPPGSGNPPSTDTAATTVADPPTTTALPSPGAPSTTPTTPGWRGPTNLLGRIVYSAGERTQTALWSMRPDGTDRRQEVPCPSSTGRSVFATAVSPDGTRVIRACGLPLDPRFPEPMAQMLVGFEWVIQRVDGSGTVPLSPTTRLHPDHTKPAWSPDGTKIAVAASGNELIIIDASTGVERRIEPRGGDPMSFTTASWAPDSRHVVVSDLIVVDTVDGSTDYRLRTIFDGVDLPYSMEVWAPDGWVYFRQKFGIGVNPRIERLLRIRLGDSSPELVLEQPWPDDWSPASWPVFLDADHALVAFDGALWKLTITQRDLDRYIAPNGTLTKVLAEFDGWYLSRA